MGGIWYKESGQSDHAFLERLPCTGAKEHIDSGCAWAVGAWLISLCSFLCFQSFCLAHVIHFCNCIDDTLK